jgi:superfamily II DNA helicase RecQ
MALLYSEATVLVISPIKSLMEDQVCLPSVIAYLLQVHSMTALGLASVAINSDTVIQDPELWNKVQRGDYRLVYGTPESILKATSPFWRLL